ncbi:SgcJ/EcaC family oxidoreductase [Fodinicola feengrottensis]|uniref:SgcJ/EcaC family oxidoreductase n=1 Tax=Fodinicola feengrottensis TaxID=435914 RepID=A0ABP4VIM8_9ACTN|nr:SgcJ/EcaC family oxidoreductase [Fodinicola feengrottensis]
MTTITTDEQAVRDVLTQLYVTWTDYDADAFATFYTADATIVLPGRYHRGDSAVRDYMAAGFAGPLQGSRVVDDVVDLRIVGGDTAIVVTEGGVVMAGATEPAVLIRATSVLAKINGEWKIAAYTNAPVG